MHGQTTDIRSSVASNTQSSWTIVLLVIAAIGSYVLLHPYLGITHDARLYCLQALNHLHPDLYANDIFLRYGSQDDYTYFTPLFALLLSHLGVEPAASLLTFASQLAFLAAVLLLALCLLPARFALIALILLLLLPDHYGSQHIFTYLEEFITPRQLAEALVLFGLAAWARNWRTTSIVLICAAMLTHPIMGLSGAALVFTLAVLPYWRQVYALAAAASLLFAAAVFAGWFPSHWRLDDEWLAIIMGRAEYLSLFNWSSDDWGRVVTVVVTLAVAAKILRGEIQRLAVAIILSTSALLLLSLIGGDLLRITLVVQAQPWRALWLATVLAILLLPAVIIECWRDHGVRRCAALLLAASWLVPSENLALLIGPLAMTAIAYCGLDLDERKTRLLLWGSRAVLGIALCAGVAVSVLSLSAGTYNISVSPLLDLLRGAGSGGALIPIVLVTGYLICRFADDRTLIALSVTLAILVTAAIVPTARTWLAIHYDDELKAAFDEWRERIPPGSDVMWAADTSMGADGAVGTWLLLERPSYISRTQTTTSLFSRAAAMEIRRRSQSLIGLLPDIESLYPKNAKIAVPESLSLLRVCESSSVRYIVTQAVFIDATPLRAPREIRNPFRNLNLYVCP
jgi:hypothetical protein